MLISVLEGLIELAKSRLPQWREHFYIANSFFWIPELKFDFIHVGGLGQVPEDDEFMFFEHLVENYLAEDGRLILGPSWCENDDSRYKGIKKLLDSGISPNGYIEKTHYKNPNKLRRAVWFDKDLYK